ncbi:ArsR/SmtB family transcription factor [Amycolatopsis sp. cg5]|uniref:ArsR/SmtB family transcription factor n=1 Tax=Amycolatopsis sp. cg5 TaxID=3238802 RepID=UPI0035269DF1
MLHIRLTWHDLTRIGLAPAADPFGEIVASLGVLRRRSGVGAFGWWKQRVRTRLPVATPMLIWLSRTAPELLMPAAGRHGFEAGLAALQASAIEEALTDSQLEAHDPIKALRDYYEIAVAPHWETIRSQVEADREMRARILLENGVDALLTSLPWLQWSYPVPEGPDLGRGLSLVPAYFAAAPTMIGAGPNPPRLLYPAARLGTPSAKPRDVRIPVPSKALAALLGPTRAEALLILAVGCGTSELAERLGVSPSAVSKHTAVLREAGLITTHRDRNTVLHSLTPLGNALLSS